MDSFTTQISQLRTALTAALAQVDGLAAAASAIPTATPVVAANAGAGLPPTEGAQGPAEEHPWRALADPHAGDSWRATAAALAAAATLPPPPPIQAQQTLGVATPAKFGDAEANAQHYLSGKCLYAPTQEQEDTAAALAAMVQAHRTFLSGAPRGEKGAARVELNRAMARHRAAERQLRQAEKKHARYQEYYDGTYSCQGDLYYVYRFYVFRIPEGRAKYWETKRWTPIGLLNPHAYIANEALETQVFRQKWMMDFCDATQPQPVLPAELGKPWGRTMWEAQAAEDGEDEVELEAEEEDEDDDSLSSCSEEDEEEAEFWRAREAAAAERYAAAPAPAPAPAPAYVPVASLPPVPFLPDVPRHPPVLQRQNAVVDSAVSTPPVAGAPPALPRMAHPTLEMVEGTTDILESVVLGEKAMQYESELKAMEGPWVDIGRWRSLEKAYRGGWTTLPDGRKAMLWAFHAFAPPLNSTYRMPQPLVHLGLYNITDRSLDTSEAPPALPKNQGDWPW